MHILFVLSTKKNSISYPFTTTLTILFLITITFTISFPSVCFLTLSLLNAFSFIVSSISGIITVISNTMFNINEDDYKESIENLDNVTKELILLGYDLDDDALYNGILYTDGVIEFSDKYDNNYYVYEKEENGYYKYYTLANGDLDACFKDEMMHNDITKVIRRGLNKSKQNKK